MNPGSNPALLPFRRLGIFVLSIDAPVDSAVSGSGANVSDLVVARTFRFLDNLYFHRYDSIQKT